MNMEFIISEELEELKPCPFCGSSVEISTFQNGNLWDGTPVYDYFIGCDKCQFNFGGTLDITLCDNPKELTIEMWNKRV